MQQVNHELPSSEHFTLHQLAVGVYAAVATEGGAAYSNAGIIDLGGQTLIFDTFETPRAAEDLRAAAERLTGRPGDCVIISHAHPDHWLGNQVFASHAHIITTHEISADMSEFGGEYAEFKENPSELDDLIREYEERLQTEDDPRQRASLESLITRERYALEMLPTLEICLSNLTFDGKLVFRGARRKAELMTRGRGHASSDCFLVLEAERIAFIGDLGFFQCQPFMAYCDPVAWIAQLEQLGRSNIEVFVPGHGPPGAKADLALQAKYIRTLDELVGQVVQEGGTVEDALQISLPEPFGAWLDAGIARFETNVRSAYQRLSGEEAD